jgi:hypothetical protein
MLKSDRWFRTATEWREARELVLEASSGLDFSPLRRCVLAWRAPCWWLDFYIASETPECLEVIEDICSDVDAMDAGLAIDHRVVAITGPLPPLGDQEELIFEGVTP